MPTDSPLPPASDPPPPRPRPWPLLATRPGPKLRLFRILHERRENPRNGHQIDALVLDSADWVNVVPVTPRGEIVFVRQFRFGIRTDTLEIPGGLISRGEEPLLAARRELREETGMVARSIRSLGAVEPNPAFLTNLCHQFLAEGVEPAGALELDPGEDVVVERHSFAAVRRMVADGTIRHSLVLTALARVLDLRDGSVDSFR